MAVNDELGKRMKDYYESIPKTKLTRRTPVAIRIDGKAFHTFTRGMSKPFDRILTQTMYDTTQYLCENIQGAVFGYTQSDEITIIIIDYQKLTSSAWFDYEVQKICSVSASMATMAFNKFFRINVEALPDNDITDDELEMYRDKYDKAMFDSRCFNIPKEEVANLIYWRQLDAQRNSIQSIGQAFFSHSQLQNKSCNEIQEMLFQEKNINWNDQPTRYKRGVAIIRELQPTDPPTLKEIDTGGPATDIVEVVRSRWIINYEMPLIKGTNRSYVEDRILYYPTENE